MNSLNEIAINCEIHFTNDTYDGFCDINSKFILSHFAGCTFPPVDISFSNALIEKRVKSTLSKYENENKRKWNLASMKALKCLNKISQKQDWSNIISVLENEIIKKSLNFKIFKFRNNKKFLLALYNYVYSMLVIIQK